MVWGGEFGAARFEGHDLLCLRGGRVVLRRLGFRVDAGGALVLRGANGSGKSTLLRAMAGLTPPAAGRLTWNGADVGRDWDSHRLRLHYIGHADAVKPALTVLENARFWARLRQADQAAEPALDAFALLPLRDIPARLMSQGQRRRLALSRLLLGHAPLWLLDEPRAGLDVASAARLDAVIARHRRVGGIVVLALHGAGEPDGATALDLDAAHHDTVDMVDLDAARHAMSDIDGPHPGAGGGRDAC